MNSVIETPIIPFDTARLEKIVLGYAKNVCLWWDGTLRAARGHNATCEWGFDGQVHFHKKLLTNLPTKSTMKTNQGSNLPGKEQ